MTHTIPLRNDQDPLKAYELVARTSQSRNHMVLDLKLYWAGKRAAGPLPYFRACNATRMPVGKTRWLSPADQLAIRESSMSLDELTRMYDLDILIVQDVRR